MATDSFKIPAADVHEPIQIWLARTFDKKMSDYRLVVLEGRCFFQHKDHKNVLVCANCVEDCKRYHLEYRPPGTTPGKGTPMHTLTCHGCKTEFSLSDSLENATQVHLQFPPNDTDAR